MSHSHWLQERSHGTASFRDAREKGRRCSLTFSQFDIYHVPLLIIQYAHHFSTSCLLPLRHQKQQVTSGGERPASVGGTQQALTVMVQGQGQTTGQLQVIPQGVTVIPGPGQQLMQAALPNGQMQRFLFTPLPSPAAPASTTGNITSRRCDF